MQQYVHDRLMREREVDFRFRIFGAVVMIVLDRLLEGIESFAGIMEIGNGLAEAAARKVHQQPLEFTKGAPGLKSLLGRLHRLEGLDSFDKQEGAPNAVVAIEKKRAAFTGGDDDQRPARDVAHVLRLESFADVSGHPHDVIHDGGRIFEYASIDLLMDITHAGSTLAVSGGVSFVDVADLEGFGVEDFAVDLKLLRNILKLFLLIGHTQYAPPMEYHNPSRVNRKQCVGSCSGVTMRLAGTWHIRHHSGKFGAWSLELLWILVLGVRSRHDQFARDHF